MPHTGRRSSPLALVGRVGGGAEGSRRAAGAEFAWRFVRGWPGIAQTVSQELTLCNDRVPHLPPTLPRLFCPAKAHQGSHRLAAVASAPVPPFSVSVRPVTNPAWQTLHTREPAGPVGQGRARQEGEGSLADSHCRSVLRHRNLRHSSAGKGPHQPTNFSSTARTIAIHPARGPSRALTCDGCVAARGARLAAHRLGGGGGEAPRAQSAGVGTSAVHASLVAGRAAECREQQQG